MSDDTATVQRVLPGERADRPFSLLVVQGPDRGARFDLAAAEQARVLLGQSPACFVMLHDPQVSRRHAMLEPHGGRLRIADLGSTNGTWVNGVAVESALLSGGETIQVGDTLLQVAADVASSASRQALPTGFGRVVGASAAMRRLYPRCQKLAAAAVPMVIEGETGTGKEVLAEAIHECGPRAQEPFVVFDCTTVAPSLLESALFGHEKGAFTGATSLRRGVFEQAHGGTLLIDEIGELDLSLQPKLLRAIQRSEIQRVGGDKWLRVDVRVIGATRRDLDREVTQGRFRDDLFYRLAVGRVELPPLRERRGDVTLLANHFWLTLGGPPPGPPAAMLERFERSPWPGNVRELHNAVAREIALGDTTLGADPLEAEGDAAEGRGAGVAPPTQDSVDAILELDLAFPLARDRVMADFERRYVARILEKYDHNIARAASASGIARRYFQQIKARVRGAGR